MLWSTLLSATGWLLLLATILPRGIECSDTVVDAAHPPLPKTTAVVTTKRVGVVLSEGFELLDAMGPYEALKEVQEKCYSRVDIRDRTWKKDGDSGLSCHDERLRVEVVLASFGSGDRGPPGVIVSSSGVPLRAEFDLSQDTDATYFDLLVLGAGAVDESDPNALAYLQKHHARGGSILTVCTGARFVASLGLLDGLEATTNSLFLDSFRREFPQTHWVSLADNSRRRFVRSGPSIVTTAGITAGIDGILDQIDHWCGFEVAEATRQVLEWPLPIERRQNERNALQQQ